MTDNAQEEALSLCALLWRASFDLCGIQEATVVGCTNQETVKLLLWSLKICEGRVCLRSASKSWMLLVVVDLSKQWTASGCLTEDERF